ncbi:hypothetical protein [Pseudomonas sp. NPDC089401]|uniref:hypothetical protein n=1 Tax=Pseudomonas sp. NPDC089401 TaxID=3364462 RepID=UPI003802A381
MTSELHSLVSDAEHAARNKIKPGMVQLLEGVVLECGAEKLTFIAVIMPDELVVHYPEVKRYHKARKTVEARVQVPFYEFEEAGSVRQIDMLLNALDRAVVMIGEIRSLKFTTADSHVLKETIGKARAQLSYS